MKKQVYLLFVLVLIGNLSLLAQAENRLQTQMVIAKSGLNMRSTPGITGKKVGAIPFGAAVELKSEVTYLSDTLDYYFSPSDEGVPKKQPVTGGWVKVAYNGKEGFVYEGFLRTMYKPAFQPEMILQFEGFNCDYPSYDPLAYHWYGLIENEGQQELRLLDPSFHFVYEDDISFSGMTTGIDRATRFLIGTKKQLAARKLPSAGSIPLPIRMGKREWVEDGFEHVAFRMYWVKTPDSEESTFRLMLQANGKTKPISTDALYETLYHFQHMQYDLLWFGDLNQDGLLDFVFRFGFEYSTTVLFMGDAEEGVKALARYEMGPCC